MTSPLQPPTQFLNVSAAVSGISLSEQRAFETGTAAPTTISNLNGEGLKITWNILRTRSSHTDYGECTITNMSPAFRGVLYETWQRFSATLTGFRVGVHIGWGGKVNLVMMGDCWDFMPARREGEDVVSVFKFGDGQKPVKEATTDTPKVYTYEAGASIGLWLTISDMFHQLGGLRIDPAMQAVFTAAVQRTPIAASGSWALQGELVDNINDLLDTFGLEWKVYNGQVIFLQRGITASSQGTLAAVLEADSGLISYEVMDDSGINVTALAQPSIIPGTQFTVRDAFGKTIGAPGFRVETIGFVGSTDGDSIMNIVGRRSVAVLG
jgi:hypothetical protein